MRLHLDANRNIPSTYPKSFFRVETWRTGSYVADFTSEAEASAFAIQHAKDTGCRYDHKVSRVHMTA
jgi:hypothetical protein